jgi:hypothetical protein
MNAKTLDLERGLHAESELLGALAAAGYQTRAAGEVRGRGARLTQVNGKWVRAPDFEVRPLNAEPGQQLLVEVKSLTPFNPDSDDDAPEEFEAFRLRREVLADYISQDKGNFYIVVQRNPRPGKEPRRPDAASVQSPAPRRWFVIAASALRQEFDSAVNQEYVVWRRERMKPLNELFPEIGTIEPTLRPTGFDGDRADREWVGVPVPGTQECVSHSVVCTADVLTAEHICELLRSGIKVSVWGSDAEVAKATKFVESSFWTQGITLDDLTKASRLFEPATGAHPPGLLMIDGIVVAGQLVRDLVPTGFDIEQFEVEHADPTEHIVVQAGAGAGKTTVMLGRILYLLATQPGIDPCHLTLVTFTRKATREMRERLGSLLTARMKVATGDQARFVRWLTFSNDFTIQTIDAYCKGLIQRYGKSIARAEKVRLTQLRTRRREELERALEEELRNDPARRLFGRPHYEFVSLALEFWTTIDTKSIEVGGAAVNAMQHYAVAPHSQDVRLLFRIIQAAARRLTDWKELQGLTELSDLGFVVNRVDLREVDQGPRGLRYLMIDEFQDTSDNQIDLILKLAGQNSGLRVFCVGDEKQAIYRFRGAEYTALQKVTNNLPGAKTYHLSSNYRTEPRLLESMEGQHFDSWRRSVRELLPSGGARLLGKARIAGAEPGRIESLVAGQGKPDDAFKQALTGRLRAIFDDPTISTALPGETITFLVRDNAHAQFVREVVDGMNRPDTRWVEAANDRLFVDRPAVNAPAALIALLRWFAAPDDLRAAVNLLWSGWVEGVPWQDIEALALGAWDREEEVGDDVARRTWIVERTASLDDLRKLATTTPIPALLARAVTESAILRCHPAVDSGDPSSSERLRRNIFLVLTHLLADTSESQWSVAGCIEWLERKLNTDRETMAWQPPGSTSPAGPNPTPNIRWLEVLTVHKAKGLERKYVVLPITFASQPVRKEGFFAPKAGALRWRIEPADGEPILNEPWNVEVTEQAEVDREQARLLYVAMTRAKNRLYVVLPEGNAPAHSWARLLKTGQFS